jgi:hypothetical protein
MAHATDTPPTDSGHAAHDDAERPAWGAETPPVENLLYRGESVESALAVSDGRLVTTTHRVLALNPIGEARVRTCDRANVEDVRPDTVADHQFAAPTLKALVAGLVLTTAGLLVSFDGLLSPLQTDSVPGLEPFFALFSLLQRSLALLDDLLLVGGLLSLVVGLGGLAWYLNSRTPVVRVTVAGSEDLVVGGSVADQRDLFAFRDLLRTVPDDE